MKHIPRFAVHFPNRPSSVLVHTTLRTKTPAGTGMWYFKGGASSFLARGERLRSLTLKLLHNTKCKQPRLAYKQSTVDDTKCSCIAMLVWQMQLQKKRNFLLLLVLLFPLLLLLLIHHPHSSCFIFFSSFCFLFFSLCVSWFFSSSWCPSCFPPSPFSHISTVKWLRHLPGVREVVRELVYIHMCICTRPCMCKPSRAQMNTIGERLISIIHAPLAESRSFSCLTWRRLRRTHRCDMDENQSTSDYLNNRDAELHYSARLWWIQNNLV